MAYVFMFPGQGSQFVGMGADLVEKTPSVAARFAEADAVLGRSLSSLMLAGPEEDLKATQNTQPALFTMEAALVDVLREKGIAPSYTLGHSLGEYSALYAAGVFSFEDGLRLVAKRGELMAKVGAATKGAMSAVLGLSAAAIREVLKQVTVGVVVPANENTPDQTVISGEAAAVEAAAEVLKAAGAKRVLPLPVSGAFHSPLMKPAADEFRVYLDTVHFADARCPVITNVTAAPETSGAVLKGLLYDQLLNPVRWVDSIACLNGIGTFDAFEIGPGAVLKGLVKKCAPDMNVVSCGTADNVYSV